MRGLLFAAFLGYTVGLLTAPKKGSELREDIVDKVNQLQDKSMETLDELQSSGKMLIERADKAVHEFKDEACQMRDKAACSLNEAKDRGIAMVNDTKEQVTHKVNALKEQGQQMAEQAKQQYTTVKQLANDTICDAKEIVGNRFTEAKKLACDMKQTATETFNEAKQSALNTLEEPGFGPGQMRESA